VRGCRPVSVVGHLQLRFADLLVDEGPTALLPTATSSRLYVDGNGLGAGDGPRLSGISTRWCARCESTSGIWEWRSIVFETEAAVVAMLRPPSEVCSSLAGSRRRLGSPVAAIARADLRRAAGELGSTTAICAPMRASAFAIGFASISRQRVRCGASLMSPRVTDYRGGRSALGGRTATGLPRSPHRTTAMRAFCRRGRVARRLCGVSPLDAGIAAVFALLGGRGDLIMSSS
jgi:hypothetical protein